VEVKRGGSVSLKVVVSKVQALQSREHREVGAKLGGSVTLEFVAS
jgi:hypothetical protein